MGNLAFIGGSLTISGNLALTSLQGLEDLGHLGGGFTLYSNPALAALTQMVNLNTIGGELKIHWSALTSLEGFQNLTSIAGNLYIGLNNSLASLTGLDNISAASITSLEIINNSSLSTCHVQSICDYLVVPNGTVTIQDNAVGCSNPAEVQAACAMSIDEAIFDGFSITPNPFSGMLCIELDLPKTSLVSIQIFNAMGAKVAELHHGHLPAGQQQFTWHTGNLPKGLYFCRVQAGREAFTQKIIKVQ